MPEGRKPLNCFPLIGGSGAKDKSHSGVFRHQGLPTEAWWRLTPTQPANWLTRIGRIVMDRNVHIVLKNTRNVSNSTQECRSAHRLGGAFLTKELDGIVVSISTRHWGS